MAGEWPMLSLRDAGITLIDCDHRTPPPSETGFPYVAIPQLRNGRIDLTGVRRITREHFTEWTRKAKPTANDVVLSRRCNPGETAFVPAGLEFALGQNLVLLRADGEKIYPPFLRWLVRGPEWWGQIGKFLNVGAVFDSLKCADVPKFELHIPPIDEQRAVAHILGTLDDKIELNRRMNETLETIARAIFRSWFVDFDPVRAKAQGEAPESICRRLRLTPDLLVLFPNRLVDSELGEIPEGWETRKVEKLLSRLSAKVRYTKNEVKPYGAIPVFEQGAGILLGYHDGKAQFEVSSEDPAFIFGDHTCVTYLACEPFDISQNVIPLKGSDRPTLWVFYAVRDKQVFQEYRRHWMELITKDVVVAPERICEAFTEQMTPMHLGMEANVRQNHSLAEIRDALLPKLFSGELRVPNAEGKLRVTA